MDARQVLADSQEAANRVPIIVTATVGALTLPPFSFTDDNEPMLNDPLQASTPCGRRIAIMSGAC